MPFDPLATQIFTRANWVGRRESLEQVADRLRRFLDDLIAIDDSLKSWSVGQKRKAHYSSVRRDLAALVRDDLMHDEIGDEEVDAGYTIMGMSGDRLQIFSFSGVAGSIYPWPTANRIRFYTNSGRTPDPTIVTYRLVKAVTLATLAAWEPLYLLTGCSDLEPKPETGGTTKPGSPTCHPPMQRASTLSACRSQSARPMVACFSRPPRMFSTRKTPHMSMVRAAFRRLCGH